MCLVSKSSRKNTRWRETHRVSIPLHEHNTAGLNTADTPVKLLINVFIKHGTLMIGYHGHGMLLTLPAAQYLHTS